MASFVKVGNRLIINEKDRDGKNGIKDGKTASQGDCGLLIALQEQVEERKTPEVPLCEKCFESLPYLLEETEREI